MNDSRELLVGCALIALAIESSKEQAALNTSVLLSAIKRLSIHSDGRDLDRYNPPGQKPISVLAFEAKALADCCLEMLDDGKKIP
jgi:hypothetical protein